MQRRLAILFGAGASFGAGDVRPYPPPLGNHLFNVLEQHCPRTWGQLPAHYKRMLRADFETGMGELWEQADLAPSQLFIDMGVYFTRFDPPGDGSDCYTHLLRAIQGRGLVGQTVIASLNYECILDVAAKPVGLLLAYLGKAGAPPPGNLLILKPHGACNLLPAAQVHGMSLVAAGGESGFYNGGLPNVPPSLPAVRQAYAEGFALPPMMSMYSKTKHSPVGRSFLQQTRDQWRQWVATCSAICCIGARPVLWDEHVWDPIIASDAPCWFVGGRDPAYEELSSRLGSRLHFVAPTFKEAVPMIERRLDAFNR